MRSVKPGSEWPRNFCTWTAFQPERKRVVAQVLAEGSEPPRCRARGPEADRTRLSRGVPEPHLQLLAKRALESFRVTVA